MPLLEPSPAAPCTATSTKRWHAPLRTLVSAQRAGPLWFHCLLAWPAGLLPSVALLGLAHVMAALLGLDAAAFQPPARVLSVGEFFSGVVFAPVVETLMLGGLLWLLSRLSPQPLFVAAMSGLLWGALHGTFGLLWFFGTAWTFYVLGCCYLAWRPQGWWKAFVAAALPHALINLTALSMRLLD